ncbi:MAG: nickel pincer cofactor biosynthesis protein LarC [Anaerolineales bacterium]
MKVLYFDLIAGASGDMVLGALIDAGVSADQLRAELAGLKLDEFDLQVKKVTKNGFQATKVDVAVGEQPPERHLAQILEIITESDLPTSVKERSTAIFRRIAEVESAIHNTSPDQIHLHELGGTDTIVDVTGVLLALDILEISRVFSSSVPLGKGFIEGAHGQIPLPAPATARLLEGIPVVGMDLEAELVTPTGAALLAALVEKFGPVPEMSLENIGYGAGSRDLVIPNLLRVLIGSLQEETEERPQQLVILECNLDDLNPEIYPYVMETLFQNGALDVSLIPVHMKKNRPGVQIQVLAEPFQAAKMREILFKETSTLGIRQLPAARYALSRKSITIKTPFGEIRLKIASGPEGEINISPEYEDCQRAAREYGIPLKQVYQDALSIYLAGSGK